MSLVKRVTAELIGTAMLLAAVIGSGVMGDGLGLRFRQSRQREQ